MLFPNLSTRLVGVIGAQEIEKRNQPEIQDPKDTTDYTLKLEQLRREKGSLPMIKLNYSGSSKPSTERV